MVVNDSFAHFDKDATFILGTTVRIFKMQTGFGLLESGLVSPRNEINIMVKNLLDVIFGGLAYWAVGYGLSSGRPSAWSFGFCGFDSFFFDPENSHAHGTGAEYAKYLFHFSFATTATTIVSGAMAERTYLRSYLCFTSVVILIHTLPAHWIWADDGVLRRMGAVDVAGASAVHIVGGAIGLAATVYLGPRRGRFDNGRDQATASTMSSPTNALLGTFMLWFGFIGFNCGSAWALSRGQWVPTARSAAATILSSLGGGFATTILSYAFTKKCKIDLLTTGLLSSLVAITGMCAYARPWHSLLIGAIASCLALASVWALNKARIDDPVGVIPTHLVGGIWGMLSVGIFSQPSLQQQASMPIAAGILYGGGLRFLSLQIVAISIIFCWSIVTALPFLWLLGISPLKLRISTAEEKLGSDMVEHNITAKSSPNCDHCLAQNGNRRQSFVRRLSSRIRSHPNCSYKAQEQTSNSISSKRRRSRLRFRRNGEGEASDRVERSLLQSPEVSSTNAACREELIPCVQIDCSTSERESTEEEDESFVTRL